MSDPTDDIELKDERIILVHEQGSDSVTVERQTWGRSDGVPTYYVRLAPHNVLDAGYDEAVVRLDQQSIDRLRHWLLTGEALPRGVVVPDPIGAPHEADAFSRCPGCGSVVSERFQSCHPVGVDTTKPGYQYLADTWGYCLHLGRHIGTAEPRYRPGEQR